MGFQVLGGRKESPAKRIAMAAAADDSMCARYRLEGNILSVWQGAYERKFLPAPTTHFVRFVRHGILAATLWNQGRATGSSPRQCSPEQECRAMRANDASLLPSKLSGACKTRDEVKQRNGRETRL